MKKTLYIILTFLYLRNLAQVNLVLNPSFEDTISLCLQKFNYKCCAVGNNCIVMSKYWSGPDTIQYNFKPPYSSKPNGACCVPEYYNSCGQGIVNMPGWFQYSRTGQAHSSIRAYGNEFVIWGSTSSQSLISSRDYLKGRLSSSLTQGETYCVKFYVNLHNDAAYAINALAMFVSNSPALDTAICYKPMTFFSPQIENTNGIIEDTLNWVKIEGQFVANGGESYLVIGNFRSDAATTVKPNSYGTFAFAYYLIDDVSIISGNSKAYAGEDKILCVGDSIVLGRPSEIGLDCKWYVNGGTQLNNSSQYKFKATSLGNYSYVVSMDNCGMSYDTVNISVVTDCKPIVTPSEVFFIPNIFTPNGDEINDTWSIITNMPGNFQNFSLSIYDRWGINVFSTAPDSNTPKIKWDGRTLSGVECSNGVYYYIISYTAKDGSDQKFKGTINLLR